jgi:predicted lysophospholipase L1 biosynthesis ABC-type transport system permease subunit
MNAQRAQTYENHVYRARAWTVTWSVALVALLVLMFYAYEEPTYVSFALVALAGTVLSAVSLVRVFALRLQNRIIRLEMQLRLARLGRDQDLPRLAMPQIVALRFASDSELPALIDRAIAENLPADAIKRAVRDWQGDYFRT